MVDAWSDFINDDKLMKYLEDNQNFWRRLEGKAKSLDDIERLLKAELSHCRYLEAPPSCGSLHPN